MPLGIAKQADLVKRNLIGRTNDPLNQITDPHKICHKRRRRLIINLPWCTNLLDAPLIQQNNPVGQGLCLFLVVRDHHRGDFEPLLQISNFTAQTGTHLRVEC